MGDIRGPIGGPIGVDMRGPIGVHIRGPIGVDIGGPIGGPSKHARNGYFPLKFYWP